MIHRRVAENAKEAQRKPHINGFSLRSHCALCASAVNRTLRLLRIELLIQLAV